MNFNFVKKLKNIYSNNKKIIPKKSLVIGVLVGGIVFGSIGVVAYSISSKDVSFTPDDGSWYVSNVQDAINSLYENLNYQDIYSMPEWVGLMGFNGWYNLAISLSGEKNIVDYDKDISGEFIRCQSVSNKYGYVYAAQDHYFTVIDGHNMQITRNYYNSGDLIVSSTLSNNLSYVIFPS